MLMRKLKITSIIKPYSSISQAGGIPPCGKFNHLRGQLEATNITKMNKHITILDTTLTSIDAR